jgi:hypothetical protein
VAERDGYGNLPYGGGPHGGAYVEGEDAVFDLFCIADEDMFEISLNPLVTLVGSGTQFNPNAVTWDMEVCSGGSFLADNAQIIVTHNIPDKFTAEWIVNFDNLPNDFTDLPNSHIYFSVTDAAGPLLGFFFSKVGVAYTGDVSFPAGLLQLNCTFQQLPDSDEYVSEGEYWIIRAAVDLSLDVVYFYMTKQSEYATLGHQLRAILPAIPCHHPVLCLPGQVLRGNGPHHPQPSPRGELWGRPGGALLRHHPTGRLRQLRPRGGPSGLPVASARGAFGQ